ncbi:DUF2267 domain-containing protein [Phaeovulum sp.]|jgi:uncharacterized protein (DUF2267 family)|uniref:DUF2267 domain-containing protein n=1 Tax=Phaeovulum sp. TaxID=2934796 RepID=UPI0027301DA1|nr:DUF2267 domain-containing protein [Phaeovulum sp.]MDP1669612.1 DUF2267 domain-containing protein [Phaeovulum sp.]MDP2063778.1 DUF2267 domain-containing protein [Phaeovulum sp.]MDP3862245.1 DUF2267 domain-containing protein [Phaeovulum sp.]MDZ4119749.1 DUF2267 domain-containing protein [Phaeovulum sp.]
MKTIEISTLDHAPQVVAEWLNSLGEDLGWHDKARTYMLLRATLHALRDFLTVNEAVDLAAQLPVLLRGVYYEGWIPAKTPARPRGKEAFLARVEAPFVNVPLEEPEDCVVAVFDLLRRRLSAGELGQVAHALRKPLRELWA